jgi:isoleucyl-tRNA synthetase
VRSVHHRDYPVADTSMIDTELEESMAAVREIVRIGRNLRKKEGHRVRQPLATLTVLTRDRLVAEAVTSHTDIIVEELNVKQVRTSADESEHVTLGAKANFRKLGPELGAEMRSYAALISALDPSAIETIVSGGSTTLDGRQFGPDDIIVERTPKDGTIVETGEGFAVALDTRISDELLKEGLAREVISHVQRLRREADLDVTDRILIVWNSSDDLILKSIEEHRERIGSETLALDIVREEDMGVEPLTFDGYSVRLSIEKT